MKDFPDYGDYFAKDEFLDAVDSKCIMDCDGHGYYTVGNKMTDVYVDIEALYEEPETFPSQYDGVYWFNR